MDVEYQTTQNTLCFSKETILNTKKSIARFCWITPDLEL